MSETGLKTPLHPSLVRPILLAGAERELVLINAVVIAVLVLGIGPHPLSLLTAALLATVGHSGLVLAARYDSQMWRVYSRHVVHRTYYPARALYGAPLPPIHPFNTTH
ncbi:MAG: conjugal transfer protein TrbD [bacterium]|nr:conjugal transfer protein TrbD [bacterium]